MRACLFSFSGRKAKSARRQISQAKNHIKKDHMTKIIAKTFISEQLKSGFISKHSFDVTGCNKKYWYKKQQEGQVLN